MTALVFALLVAASPPPPAALDDLVATAAARIADAGLEPPVALSISGPAPLAHAWGSLLATRLADLHLAPVVLDANSDQEHLARGAGARSLVRLDVAVEGAHLVARGDAFSTWVNFWSGNTTTRSGPSVALALEADADAPARLLAGVPEPAAPEPPRTLALTLATVVHLPAPPGAVAAGDLDGDGKPELLVLLGDELVAYTVGGQVLARADLSSGAPAARATRGGFGGLAFVPSPPRVVAWSNRRARAETLTWSGSGFRGGGNAESMTIEGLVVQLEPGFNRFAAEARFSGHPVQLGAPVQGLSTRAGVTLCTLPDGGGALVRGTPLTARRLAGVGTASALADLDGDGTPEVIVSSTHTIGEGDELRVLPLAAVELAQARGTPLAEVAGPWQATVRTRLTAAFTVDVDGDGQDEVLFGGVAADGTGELLILRRPAP